MTHGDKFNSTIALSYKLSYMQPKNEKDCAQRCVESESDSQIWVLLEASECRGKKYSKS